MQVTIRGTKLRNYSVLAALVVLQMFGAGAQAQEAIPDFYKDPGIYPNRSYLNQAATEHIDPFTGSLQLHATDIHLPGNGGFDLQIQRSYNSASVDRFKLTGTRSSMGIGWTMHFGRVLRAQQTNACSNVGPNTTADNPVLELPDGSRQRFTFPGTTTPKLLTAQRWRGECMTDGSGGLRVYSPEGTQYEMTHRATDFGSTPRPISIWYATKIIDRNGNSASITYAAASHEITRVTTSDGRTIDFTYTGTDTTRRVTSITAASQTYNYGYTAVTGVLNAYQLTTVKRPDGTTWGYEYNGDMNQSAGSHMMREVKYPQGGTVNYSYDYVYFDTQSNPLSRTDVVTRKSTSQSANWTFSYSPGRISGQFDETTVNGPDGSIAYRHIGPGYSTSGTVWMVGLLVRKTIGSLQTEVYDWDKQQISGEENFRPGAFVTKKDANTFAPLLTKKTITLNGANYVTTYSNFDTYGNPRRLVESGPNGGSRTRSLSYYLNTSKWIIAKIENESFSGSSTTRNFDSSGNLTSETINGITTSYSYDSEGNISSKTFPRNLTHNYSSYYRGVPRSESQPEGVRISRTVSDAGNVTSETNGDGRTTRYGYDAMNRITSVDYPVGNSVSINYTATTKRSTRGGLNEQITYNSFGYPIKHSLGGIDKSFTVDVFGRRTFESNPDTSSGTTYSYDILNRLTNIRNADGSNRSISYGAGTKQVRDERSNSTTYSYRSYGDPGQQILMGISAPISSASVSITRNSVDLVQSVSQNGQTRNYGYNSNYYLTSVTNPETGTTSYGRDAAGNMTSRSIGASGTTSYTYDGQNRLTRAAFPGSTPAINYTYNKTHKLLTANSSTGNRVMGYDSNNNLTSDALSVDGNTFTVQYRYNGNDALSSMTYPRSGRVVDYAPDTLGRPTKASGFISSVSYWPSGQIRVLSYANGTTTEYDQNSRLWPSSVVVKKSGTAYINSNYQYDSAGNLTSISDFTDGNFTRSLGYDSLNRLTSANGPWGTGAIDYDGGGNITSQRFGSANLSYSYSSNRLNSVSGAKSSSFTYDAMGNIKTGFGNAYTYDGAPNLTCFNCTDSVQKIEYSYDGSGFRSSVTKGGVKSYEMYDQSGNQLIEFTPSQSNKLVEYIYLAGKRIAQISPSTASPSTIALTVNPNPAQLNQSVTLSATITGSNPTGTVEFREGAVPLGTATVNSGKATYTHSFSSAGPKSIVAVYSGDNNNDTSSSAAVALTVSTQASTTSLSVNANPGVVNQPVVITATVAGSNPTGTVVFKEGANTLGSATVNAGKATFTHSFTTTGAKELKGSYSGDTDNSASESAVLLLNVNSQRTATITTLSVNPNPAYVDTAVSLKAVVTGSAPTGSVSFMNGTELVYTMSLTNGEAMITTQFQTNAPRQLKAIYNGDSANAPSNSNVVNLSFVQTGTESVTISAYGSDWIMAGSMASVNANLSFSNPSGPKGRVDFYLDSQLMKSVPIPEGTTYYTSVNDQFQIQAPGRYGIHAIYTGDINHAPASSDGFPIKVGPLSTETSVNIENCPASSDEGPIVIYWGARCGSDICPGDLNLEYNGLPVESLSLSDQPGGMISYFYKSSGEHRFQSKYPGLYAYSASASDVKICTIP